MSKRTHAEWKRALYPLALAAIKRGEHSGRPYPEHAAGIISNYAATDMVLQGHTLLLPMDEVRALDQQSRQDPTPTPASATPTEAAVAANRLDHSGRRAAA